MHKYKTFVEILESADREKAVFSAFFKGIKEDVSYGTFLDTIRSYPEIKGKTFAFLGDNSFSSILLLFILAYQKKTIVLLNPLEDEKLRKEKLNSLPFDGRVKGNQRIPYPNPKENDNKEAYFYFYTSGTTSSSKAVVLTEENLCASSYNGSYCLPLTEQDRFLSLLPLFHVFGFVCALLWPRQCHSTICLSRGMRFIGEDFTSYKPTAVSLVPQLAARLIRFHLINPERKTVLIGAGDCPDSIINSYKQRNISVSFGYGRTETSSGLALSLGENPRARTICPEVKIKIDPKDKEILVHAPTVLRKGYFQNGVLIPPRLEDGYYRTGDLGRVDEEGFLHLIGRKKEILVLPTGTKIFLPEYEAKLAEFIPNSEFAVLLSQDNKITLYIYTKETKEEIEDKVSKFNQGYARGEQIGDIIFSSVSLPKTATGKIKKYQLIEEMNHDDKK